MASSLSHWVPNTISVFFNPAAGDTMVDATIKDMIHQVGRGGELLRSHSIDDVEMLAAQSKRRAFQAAAAAVVNGSGLDRRGLSAAPTSATGVAMNDEPAVPSSSGSTAPGDAVFVEGVLKPPGAAPATRVVVEALSV